MKVKVPASAGPSCDGPAGAARHADTPPRAVARPVGTVEPKADPGRLPRTARIQRAVPGDRSDAPFTGLTGTVCELAAAAAA